MSKRARTSIVEIVGLFILVPRLRTSSSGLSQQRHSRTFHFKVKTHVPVELSLQVPTERTKQKYYDLVRISETYTPSTKKVKNFLAISILVTIL